MDSTLPVPCSKNAGLSGELFYAHKNEPGTLYEKDIDEGVLIATVPLESDGWSEFPQNRLMVYRSGEPVYAGDRHGVFRFFRAVKSVCIFMLLLRRVFKSITMDVGKNI